MMAKNLRPKNWAKTKTWAAVKNLQEKTPRGGMKIGGQAGGRADKVSRRAGRCGLAWLGPWPWGVWP